MAATFGLQGTPGEIGEMGWAEYMVEHLSGLPEVFDTVWVSDHLQFHGEPFLEGWTRLAYLAALLPRFRFGNLVLSQSYRNPGLLGAMAATLQELSGGRFILGLGAGWLEEEYRAFNWEYPSPGTRVEQLAETIQLVKTLWRDAPASWSGKHYRIENAVCRRPKEPIPLLVGTNGPRALKVAARHADWWSWDGPWEPTFREPYERLRAACEDIGRPLDEIRLVAALTISMPEDVSTYEPIYTHEFYPGQRFGVLGPTPADVIREIELLVDVGVTHFPLDIGSLRELQLFVDEVVPHVRLQRAD
jgi:alkanesulfonate monooxygenase SsuD/methylene tetrahydromethanopterin reductase-like flavin-dependent oxidoreductase (luciferase family)